MNDDPDMNQAVLALAKYLRDNPLACDTAEGISRWWLASLPVTTETLLRALDWMDRSGLVEASVAADGRLRYKRLATDGQLLALTRAAGGPATRH